MPEVLEKIIMQAVDLPTIPSIARSVVKALANPKTTINDLTRLISQDQALSARILKIANSAMYYCQREISSLNVAVARIGFISLKSIVLAVSTKDIYKTFGDAERLLWEHAVGVSIASQTLAKVVGRFKADEIFVGGLMHDIGKTLLNNKDPKKYGLVFQKVHEGGKSFIDAEREIYGFSHAEAGSLLIKKWNFPGMLSEAILIHHALHSDQQIPQTTLNTAAVINLADLICQKLGIGYTRPLDGFELSQAESAQILGVNEDCLTNLITQINTDFQENKDIFL